MEEVQEFTDSNFDTEVLQSEVPVLVDFWATWCAPCRMIAPHVQRIASDYAGKAKVGKVNVDQAKTVAQRYGVTSIPTLMVFRQGEAVDQIIGAVPLDAIKAMVDKAVI